MKSCLLVNLGPNVAAIKIVLLVSVLAAFFGTTLKMGVSAQR
jgi:hypothetical protein